MRNRRVDRVDVFDFLWRLNGAADVDQVVVADLLRQLRLGLSDGRLGRTVEDEPEGALIGVLHDQDHGPVEVVRHARRGDEQLAAEALGHPSHNRLRQWE